MNSEVPDLEYDIKRLKDELVAKEKRLNYIRSTCLHEWSKVIYDPIHRKAYTAPGDPPGTMGIDRRCPTHVPSEIERQWKRTCKHCNLTETTKYTRKEKTYNPASGTNGEVEVPVF